uniref:F-box domain-containing protein n=1 Tax=Chromera velia CCMP2878 TaxID=1169474 RepID=A0A0G4HCB9_9ALVE|eukprot:Cvel_6312.t1-p1 / transcript=Cvel_6312.t1 / gene=Cvel_6312 / organism=Chromera_velia_CCMP2878 / gene_product=hypothetical protein / transcript_product=hypothetical protein / location=Cvel_scaffold306:49523-50725(+) / protein_length=401 / sequence_SO=supercontig / SO=protein_coding / is_pseudo=false
MADDLREALKQETPGASEVSAALKVLIEETGRDANFANAEQLVQALMRGGDALLTSLRLPQAAPPAAAAAAAATAPPQAGAAGSGQETGEFGFDLIQLLPFILPFVPFTKRFWMALVSKAWKQVLDGSAVVWEDVRLLGQNKTKVFRFLDKHAARFAMAKILTCSERDKAAKGKWKKIFSVMPNLRALAFPDAHQNSLCAQEFLDCAPKNKIEQVLIGRPFVPDAVTILSALPNLKYLWVQWYIDWEPRVSAAALSAGLRDLLASPGKLTNLTCLGVHMRPLYTPLRAAASDTVHLTTDALKAVMRAHETLQVLHIGESELLNIDDAQLRINMDELREEAARLSAEREKPLVVRCIRERLPWVGSISNSRYLDLCRERYVTDPQIGVIWPRLFAPQFYFRE